MDAIDFHAHLDSSQARLSQLSEAQKRAGISSTVVVSGNMLDTLHLGDYLRGTFALDEVEPNNGYLGGVAAGTEGRLLPFFTIDPQFHEADDLRLAAQSGFLGFKLNPIVHRVDFTTPALAALLEVVNDLAAPLYLHITLHPAANLESTIALARRFGDMNFVIGHMGFATSDMAAIEACAAIRNLFLETSVGSVLALREIRRRRLIEKLLFGSEFPTHDPAVELEKLRLCFPPSELDYIVRYNSTNLLAWNAPRAIID